MPLFAVTYRYEAAQATAREANKPAHREWLAARSEDGQVLTVGPFVDGSGALLIVSADDSDTACALVEADPHRLAGFVSELTVHQWTPVFGAFT